MSFRCGMQGPLGRWGNRRPVFARLRVECCWWRRHGGGGRGGVGKTGGGMGREEAKGSLWPYPPVL